jgi:hypothetical protein
MLAHVVVVPKHCSVHHFIWFMIDDAFSALVAVVSTNCGIKHCKSILGSCSLIKVLVALYTIGLGQCDLRNTMALYEELMIAIVATAY